MTVVQVQAEGAGVELVRELLTHLDQPAADLLTDAGGAVHCRRMDSVTVNGVRMRAGVDEVDAQQIAFACAQGWTGDAAVVCPGGVPHAGDDLDLLVVRDELPFAEGATAGQ